MEIMEFEKLQQIIAEVLNIDPEEITMNTTFVDDLGAEIGRASCRERV